MTDQDSLLAAVGQELEDMFSASAVKVSDSRRVDIQNEIMRQTKLVLDSLSREELESTIAFERFVERAMDDARMRMHGVMS